MHTLVVYCHPYEESFNHAVLGALVRRLEREGRSHAVQDLYADGFRPAMTAAELAVYGEGTILDPLVARYVSELREAGHLAMVFPVWWNDAPAMLRGWLDRVLLCGHTWSVGPQGLYGTLDALKSVTLYTTSDNPTEFLVERVGNGLRRSFLDGTFMQLGVPRREWHNFGCVGLSTEDERHAWLAQVEGSGDEK